MSFHLLKPTVQTIWLRQGMGSRVDFLDVPADLDKRKLHEDIKKGAAYLADVEKIVEKGSPSNFTIIHTNSEEQGYMAISYLASLYNKAEHVMPKVARGDGAGNVIEGTSNERVQDEDPMLDFGDFESDEVQWAEEEDDYEEEEDTPWDDWPSDATSEAEREENKRRRELVSGLYGETWVEDEWRIPIIALADIISYEQQINVYNQGPRSFLGQEDRASNPPYWAECHKEPIIIKMRSNASYPTIGIFDDDGNFGDLDVTRKFKRFESNRHIFLLYVANSYSMMDILDVAEKSNASNHRMEYRVDAETKKQISAFRLSYLANVAYIHLNDESKEKYVAKLLPAWCEEYGYTLKKRFPTLRIAKTILSLGLMPQWCSSLTEKIVRYVTAEVKSGAVLDVKAFSAMTEFGEIVAAKYVKKVDALERLNKNIIGMEDVKEEIMRIIYMQRYNAARDKFGLPNDNYHNTHLLLGPPGTAKTTIAEMTGEIMAQEGLISGGRFISLNGAQLKAEYVGHTAPKVHRLFQDYDIILIDEAYSICDGDFDDSFSAEAISQLIIELEKHACDKLVFFAGYGGSDTSSKNNKMRLFVDANPGIKSRINSTIEFSSYTPEQMADIVYLHAANNKFRLDKSVRDNIIEYFAERQHALNFGNGREARSLLENAVSFAAARTMRETDRKITKSALQRIRADDVLKSIANARRSNRSQIGQTQKTAVLQ